VNGAPINWIGTKLVHAQVPSSNINERVKGQAVSILLLHYTGMETAAKALHWLTAPESQVSCHYLVDEHGAITQMVDENMRGWHAGAGSWRGEEDVNSRSIGIEIHNPGHTHGYIDFPQMQMTAVADLAHDIISRHNILARDVLAHSDIAPARKIDPGEKFDWKFLHEKGVGHWVAPEPISGGSFLQQGDKGDAVLALQSLLKLYGYGIQLTSFFDEATKQTVAAFQRHFRPAKVDGVADQSTVATLHKLLRSIET
jgi:N-acetylmuramoyl-L-alanine amidase